MCTGNVLLRTNKNTLHVQVNNLLERILRVLVEFLSPCCTSIGKQDIYFIRVLLHLFNQSLNFSGFCEVGGDGDGFAVSGEFVESCAGFFAGFLLSGCDEDLGAAGLGEPESLLEEPRDEGMFHHYIPGCCVQTQSSGATSDYSNFAIESEEGGEVLELDVCFGRHDCYFSGDGDEE